MSVSDKIGFLNNIIMLLPDCISNEVKRFIACQFSLESDFGNSPFALCNNNYCGMKVASFRLTFALNLEEKGQFAHFSGITSCVHDYLLWLQSNKFSRAELDNLGLFVQHLKLSGYCPEYDYIDKIEKLYHKFYG